MSDVALIIRQIRKATGATQANLAKSLGVDQTAVSQWERGRTTPSTDILMILHGLAGPEDQIRLRRILSDRLQNLSSWGVDDLLNKIHRYDFALGHEQLVGTVLGGILQRRKRIQPFLEEVRKLVESGLSIDPSLTTTVRLYREHGRSARTLDVFRSAASYIEVQFEKRSAPRRKCGSARRRKSQSLSESRTVEGKSPAAPAAPRGRPTIKADSPTEPPPGEEAPVNEP